MLPVRTFSNDGLKWWGVRKIFRFSSFIMSECSWILVRLGEFNFKKFQFHSVTTTGWKPVVKVGVVYFLSLKLRIF